MERSILNELCQISGGIQLLRASTFLVWAQKFQAGQTLEPLKIFDVRRLSSPSKIIELGSDDGFWALLGNF
jgi:hypothetical protein